MNIDLDAGQFSLDDAENILQMIYQTYHDRPVDPIGRKDFIPPPDQIWISWACLCSRCSRSLTRNGRSCP